MGWTRLLAVCLALSLATSLGATVRLDLDVPSRWEAEASDLVERSEARLEAAARMVGAGHDQRPITVVFLEGEPAQEIAPWIAGFAQPERDLIVLLPNRVPTYPDDDLAVLLVHEVTHVLSARAAGSASVPRWFSEGIALIASRGWSMSDRSRALVGGLWSGPSSVAELEELFSGGAADVSSAYALSGALVRDLVADHGYGVVAALLGRLSEGQSYAGAFLLATGEPWASAERRFFRRAALWYRWVPFLTSGATLWMVVTLLAVAAAARRRRRDVEVLERWDREEAAFELGTDVDSEPADASTRRDSGPGLG